MPLTTWCQPAPAPVSLLTHSNHVKREVRLHSQLQHYNVINLYAAFSQVSACCLRKISAVRPSGVQCITGIISNQRQRRHMSYPFSHVASCRSFKPSAHEVHDREFTPWPSYVIPTSFSPMPCHDASVVAGPAGGLGGGGGGGRRPIHGAQGESTTGFCVQRIHEKKALSAKHVQLLLS